jgi:lactobin A/cerein 7B family class IIb bacteriocin
MNANIPATLSQSADIRTLSDAEIDGVSGGFIPLVLAIWAINCGIAAGLAYWAITAP